MLSVEFLRLRKLQPNQSNFDSILPKERLFRAVMYPHSRLQHAREGPDELSVIEERKLQLFLETGTEDSFEWVCRWLSPRLMRFFRVRGCDNTVSEDLTQDVLFNVFRHASEIRDQRLFRGWVYTIARNSLLQRWRKTKRDAGLIALDNLGAKTPAAHPHLAPENPFAQLVACLSPDQREILTLRFVDGLDYREIASALDIPVGTAKWRVFNSKLKLSVQMQSARMRKERR